ncbi:MAG TPA: class 1 fructose-bisphosphatase [Planctomycetaceae bacterium]|nr:class 1 fructose-bisphosphatase [Planctomycetaceae bacterium]
MTTAPLRSLEYRPPPLHERPIITVQQHILEEQKRFPGASGEFSWLLSGVTLATKMIQAQVRRAGLTDILGEHGATNVQGEIQQKLDVYANRILLHCLSVRESIGLLASEENERPLTVHNDSPHARYAVIFDPLDGSSNIDVGVSVGTTFSILRRPTDAGLDDAERWVLQPGTEQVAAGYVLYGSSTILVYSAGQGVHGFTLDPAIGAYVLSHENVRIPPHGTYYSVNEAYRDDFPPACQVFLDRLRSGALGRRYASRYIGSMVADLHRTLLKGGIFLYPPTGSHPAGKLRLMYEANPLAFLIEQAGGRATDGAQRILDIRPESLHQRTPLVAGSPAEMDAFERCVLDVERSGPQGSVSISERTNAPCQT